MDPEELEISDVPQLTGKSGGGLAGLHGPPHPTALVGPSTEEQKNTLRIALMPFACWRMEDLRFEFDSSFILASAHNELLLLVELLKAHPGALLSIFGHADPVGNVDYNKAL